MVKPAILGVLLFFGLVFPSMVEAQVVVNEFSSKGGSDWVEIYNLEDATASADLSEYRLRDSTETNKKDLSGELQAGGYIVFDWGALNQDKDVLRLMRLDGETETEIFRVAYGTQGEVCAPDEGQSIGRKPDGTGGFVRFGSQTSGTANLAAELACATPTPTASPQPTPTATAGAATATPTATPTAKPTVKPTVTPKPVVKATATSKPTTPPATQAGGQAEEEEPRTRSLEEGTVQGEEDESLLVGSAEQGTEWDKSLPWVAGAFVLTGLGLVGVGLRKPILEKYNLRIRERNQKTD